MADVQQQSGVRMGVRISTRCGQNLVCLARLVRLVLLVCPVLLVGCGSAVQQGRRVPTRAKPAPCTGMLCRLDELSRDEGNAKTSARGQPWQSYFSVNFRVLHYDATLATAAAKAAEDHRLYLLRLWNRGSKSLAWTPAPWNPRCDIYLYPDEASFRETGRAERSTGCAQLQPSLLSPGCMIVRRIVAIATDPELIREVLPHELGHVVLADLLNVRDVPLWADEGFAILAGSERVMATYRDSLALVIGAAGHRLPLRDLMTMTAYPQGALDAFYGQSFSLIRFLLLLRGQSTLLTFLRQIARPMNVEAALRQHYAINSFEELDRRWVEFAAKDAPGATPGS